MCSEKILLVFWKSEPQYAHKRYACNLVSRVGAYLRQRFRGAFSIILCLGWALIQGWALIGGLHLIEALRYSRST